MTYLDQFMESISFLSEIDPGSVPHHSLIDIREELADCWLERDEACYQQVVSFIRHASAHYMDHLTTDLVVSRCHSVSTGFLESYQRHHIGAGYPLFITIGNVFYRGTPLYRHDRDDLKQLIESDADLSVLLDTHVWLTLDNMLVIDLAIAATLRSRFGLDPKEEVPSPLFWREDWNSDFVYQPLLVDNRFMYRVDRTGDAR
jgi:hypothetical protein